MVVSLGDLISRRETLADQMVRPFQSFFRKEAASSILLLGAALAAFAWSNSPLADAYHRILETEAALTLGGLELRLSLLHWINEGLMALFFFTVGLEIKREMLVGELASWRKAALPVSAALGGMLLPALIYGILNRGGPAIRGWGIPMATDIAFALGAISILGRSIPASLRIFLSALAIADDLGSVLVIALFYTDQIVWSSLLLSLLLVLGLAAANFFWVRWTLVYAVLGIALWLAVLGSGLHPTIAGITVALFIPARGRYDTDRFLQTVHRVLGEFECPPDGCGHSILLNPRHQNAVQAVEFACHDVETPLQRMEHLLHPWVAFLVVPLFALGNGGLSLTGLDPAAALGDRLTLGILLGLTVGKPLGIFCFSYVALKMRLASLPTGVTWPNILGAGCLAGIGFTMSLFIADLSFASEEMLAYAKLGIFLASVLSAALGLFLLGFRGIPRSGSERSPQRPGSRTKEPGFP